MSSETDDQSNELIDAGLDSIGGLAGTALGFALAGPAGALLGAAAGPFVPVVLRKTALEFKRRVLGQREELRVGTVLELTAAKITQNVEQGLQIRQDKFFQQQLDNRAAAEEILEGILIAAQKEHEEKKLRFYSNLIANIAFRVDINRDLANALVKLVEKISYRQLLLIAIFARDDQHKPIFNFQDEKSVQRLSIAADAYSLGQQGILILEDNNGYSISIEILGVTPLGRLIADLMELYIIDNVEIEDLKTYLSQD
jgi:hypothetical protein